MKMYFFLSVNNISTRNLSPIKIFIETFFSISNLIGNYCIFLCIFLIMKINEYIFAIWVFVIFDFIFYFLIMKNDRRPKIFSECLYQQFTDIVTLSKYSAGFLIIYNYNIYYIVYLSINNVYHLLFNV